MKPDDEELDALVADAFSEELPPATEHEVARAEAELDAEAVELPPGLAEYREPDASAAGTDPSSVAPDSLEQPRSNLVQLDPRRRWLGHAVAAALGAAAASALFVWLDDGRGPRPAGTLPSSEPAASSPDAATPPPIRLDLDPKCPETCCAGSACATADGTLAQCPSGRTCVPCSLEQRARFRVRIGALAPEGAGQQLVAGGTAELCLQAGSSKRECVPARAADDSTDPWATLPLVVSAADLVAGVELQLRVPGATLARWRGPVKLSPTVLCRGLSLPLASEKGERVGTVSAFFTDTHFVELARAGSIAELRTLAERYRTGDRGLNVYETAAEGAQRFALTAGPMDRSAAEALRWQVLSGGGRARVVLGDDHRGDALAVDTKR